MTFDFTGPVVSVLFCRNEQGCSSEITVFNASRNHVYLAGVGSSLQVSCTQHPGGDEALVNLWLVAGLRGEQRHHGGTQNHTGLSWKKTTISSMYVWESAGTLALLHYTWRNVITFKKLQMK